MNVIPQLFVYYETVRANISKPAGSVFEYPRGEDNGLKLFAELMARIRRKGMASFFVACSSVVSVNIMPTTRFHHGFAVGNKLNRLYEEGYYLLCIQMENELESGNFVILRTNELGEEISIYSVYSHKPEPYQITTLLFDYSMGIDDDLIRLSKICIDEIAMMISNVKPSNFTPLA